ncbi:unannotated protein [freshwater metagenome]|uniref:Unannotated protein n=1 Tax=freshwater metagenome TaxID=449393 RepID=A0A6J6EE18_9ZZZZ
MRCERVFGALLPEFFAGFFTSVFSFFFEVRPLRGFLVGDFFSSLI